MPFFVVCADLLVVTMYTPEKINIMVEILNTLANIFDIQWVTNYIFNRSNKLPTAWVFYRHCLELMRTLPIAE